MTQERLSLDDLAALEDQKRFLLRSLADLDRERDAGDLDETDHATLHADYTHRAAEVIRAIEEQRDLHEQARPDHRRTRTFIAVTAVAVVAICLGVVVAATSGESRPEATGGIDLTPTAEVAACIDKMQQTFRPAAQGEDNAQLATDALTTIKCFTTQIDAHPDDAVALTYRGWSLALLARQLDGQLAPEDVRSFVQRSVADLAEARKLAPRYPDALTYSAIVAVWTTDLDAAERYLAEIDALRLPADAPILAAVDQMLRPLVTAARASAATSTTAVSNPDPVPPTSATPAPPGGSSATTAP